jgi:hypothetical protein
MANSNFSSSIPAKAVDVTPSDTAGNAFTRLYCGNGGTVRIVDPEGNTSNWTVGAGTYIEQQTAKVMATGTSPLTGIVGQA